MILLNLLTSPILQAAVTIMAILFIKGLREDAIIIALAVTKCMLIGICVIAKKQKTKIMKRLLLLSTITLVFGCSGSDDDNSCHCDAIFYLEHSEEVYHTEENMTIDCETGQPTHNPTGDPDSYFVGCQD